MLNKLYLKFLRKIFKYAIRALKFYLSVQTKLTSNLTWDQSKTVVEFTTYVALAQQYHKLHNPKSPEPLPPTTQEENTCLPNE